MATEWHPQRHEAGRAAIETLLRAAQRNLADAKATTLCHHHVPFSGIHS
jgi:hypothetical protein